MSNELEEGGVELILHRGANRRGVDVAAGPADVVEVDVHRFRGRLEVRHEKVLWPSARRWERWYLLPRGAPRRELHEVLADTTAPLLVDLKGVRPSTARAVAGALASRRSLTVSTKSWWLLGAFRCRAEVRTFRSAGNRLELALLLHLPSRLRPHGIVVHQRLLHGGLVVRLHERAQLVWAWGATDRAAAERLRSWGVDGLILDDVELIRELRAGRRDGHDGP